MSLNTTSKAALIAAAMLALIFMATSCNDKSSEETFAHAATQAETNSSTAGTVNRTEAAVSITSPPVTATSPPVTATSPPVTATSPPVTATSPPVTATSPPNVQAAPLERARNLAAAATDLTGADNAWALWLINANNPLPAGYAPNLTSIGSHNGENRVLDSRAAAYAVLMIEAAKNDGISLHIVSSYRRIERQENNFRNYFNSLVSQGHSREQAFDITASQIAVPGTSEHNAGLAIDFNLIRESFDQTKEFRWLRDNSWKYGFILRYPKDTTDITGIIYEPWHFRFVGLYHAEKVVHQGITLEEYIGRCAGDASVAAAWRAQLVG
jgi:D-alanyl-D-alanine carboxypeptidase